MRPKVDGGPGPAASPNLNDRLQAPPRLAAARTIKDPRWHKAVASILRINAEIVYNAIASEANERSNDQALCVSCCRRNVHDVLRAIFAPKFSWKQQHSYELAIANKTLGVRSRLDHGEVRLPLSFLRRRGHWSGLGAGERRKRNHDQKYPPAHRNPSCDVIASCISIGLSLPRKGSADSRATVSARDEGGGVGFFLGARGL